MVRSAVIISDAPELIRYVSFLLAREPSPPSVRVAANEIEGYIAVSDTRAEVVVIDERTPLMGNAEFIRLLKETPETRRSRVLLLSGGDPEGAAGSAHLGRADRVLAKPFAPAAFREAIAPAPLGLLRAAGAWARDQFRLRFSAECYTRGQLAFATFGVALVAASAVVQIAPSAQGFSATGPRLVFWGGSCCSSASWRTCATGTSAGRRSFLSSSPCLSRSPRRRLSRRCKRSWRNYR